MSMNSYDIQEAIEGVEVITDSSLFTRDIKDNIITLIKAANELGENDNSSAIQQMRREVDSMQSTIDSASSSISDASDEIGTIESNWYDLDSALSELED
jgi:predicted  nucleic acid-binding Zn-ribbon protein